MSELFYDSGALLDRLTSGLKRRNQEVVFLVGSPFSAPTAPGLPGVPDVDGVINLIRREFSDDPTQLAAFEQLLKSPNPYQAAFVFLQGRRGPLAAHEIVREAVTAARLTVAEPLKVPAVGYSAIDDACRQMEFDNRGWALSAGAEAMGKLATAYPARFGRCLLTTNFDPLIEVSIERAGGAYFRTTLHADGNLSQTQGIGCHVIHLHGYWYGSDTLHTARQLGQPRPRLRASLSALLRDKLIVVCAYGGWDDAFTETLIDIVRDDMAFPEILWTFYSSSSVLAAPLLQRLAPGIDRGRVTLYSGIDCHHFLPELYDAWSSIEPPYCPAGPVRFNPVHASPAMVQQLETLSTKTIILEGDDEDRPPLVEICVGREQELQTVRDSLAKVVFLTGLGGQGKSTVAALHFSECQSLSTRFSFFVWRDCKEESERFENQLSSVIERLTEGRMSGPELAKQSAKAIVDILLGLISPLNALFVFDNVDHYVNLETRKMIGSADVLIEALLQTETKSRVVFTCRPSVSYELPQILNCHLEGLSSEASQRLFAERGASATAQDIQDAHQLTEGHAFWLDLIAIQVAKRPAGRSLTKLLNEIRSGGGPIPERTLNSVWTTLNAREQTVLRAMAETLKPETELEISDYLRDQLNYNKVSKALRALRNLNLIVVKPRVNGSDFLELHPLVRQFIRQSFPRPERTSYINAIIRVYKRFIDAHKPQLSARPPLSMLQYWTQNAELDIAAGKFDDAILMLAEVAGVFVSSGYPREYVRVARLWFATVDWVTDFANFKNLDLAFESHVSSLSYLGEDEEVDTLLDQYEKTVPERDVRYVRYCGMRCNCYWVRGEYTAAVEWGERGQNLKDISGVDTQYNVAHPLALAKRDAGQPESALPVFLDGRPLSDVIEPDELDEERPGSYYGNIGRCLHFMGQIASALICYQKSALLIERDPTRENVVHQAYIRMWIAELLEAGEQFNLAYVFFRAAHRKWELASPAQASKALMRCKHLEARFRNYAQLDERTVEKVSRDWILGRALDLKIVNQFQQ